MHIVLTRVGISKETEVEPEDIIGAVQTLKPTNKIVRELPSPGKGPEFFLNWAKKELEEAEGADAEIRARKFYNSVVYSKCAVECLVDWYLGGKMLNLTISQTAGAAQKLEALDSDNMLGISFGLFNDVVFEPRNRGIHKFELVEEKEARHSYELANLTVTNCQNTVSPSCSSIFYGDLEFARDAEALEKSERKLNHSENTTAFYLGGIGASGACAVYFDRSISAGRVVVMRSLGDGEIEQEYCNIKSKFSSEQLRKVYELLEENKPKKTELKKNELETVIETFSKNKTKDRTRR